MKNEQLSMKKDFYSLLNLSSGFIILSSIISASIPLAIIGTIGLVGTFVMKHI